MYLFGCFALRFWRLAFSISVLSVLNHTCNYCCLLFCVFGGPSHSNCEKTKAALFPGGENNSVKSSRKRQQTWKHRIGRGSENASKRRNGNQTKYFHRSFSEFEERIKLTRLPHFGVSLISKVLFLTKPKLSTVFYCCRCCLFPTSRPTDVGWPVKVTEGKVPVHSSQMAFPSSPRPLLQPEPSSSVSQGLPQAFRPPGMRSGPCLARCGHSSPHFCMTFLVHSRIYIGPRVPHSWSIPNLSQS